MTTLEHNNMDNEKTYKEPELNALEEEEADIDWVGLAAKLWCSKKFILIWTIIFSVLGVGVALKTTKLYTAQVTLAPEASSSGGSSSSLSGMASMLGLGGLAGRGSTADALNITLFPEMASSTPFLTDLFELKVKPYVSKEELEKGKPEKPETTLYRWILKKDEPKGFVAKTMESLFGKKEVEESTELNKKHLTKEQNRAVSALQKAIVADVDKKTGITTISVTIDDPVMAAQIADTVCQRLQDKVFKYRTQKAATDLDYYTKLSAEAKEKMIKAQTAYAISVDFDRSVILETVSSEKERLQQEAMLAEQIYQQMEQQKEMAKAKYQEAKPVFAVVEPATVPLRPSSTSRAQIAIMFMLIGFVGSAGWKLYVGDLVASFLKSMKEKMDEEKEKNVSNA